MGKAAARPRGADRFRKTPFALAIAAAFIPANSPGVSGPGQPAADEFRVNTTTAFEQSQPRIAADADGDFVVAWWQLDGSAGTRILARRYAASGVAQGSEFQVNTGGRSLDQPAVAMDADGDFVVAWQSGGQVPNYWAIFARRYDAAGQPQGDEFQVSQFTASNQTFASIAMDAEGAFVVAWTGDGQDGSSRGVFARRYDAAGVAQGDEFQVNQFTTGDQAFPAVAMDADGDFVVAWSGQDSDGRGVIARRYSSAGTALGDEFQVNQATSGEQWIPSVAVDPDGDLVVAWEGSNLYCGGYYSYYYGCYSVPYVAARRYDSARAPRTDEFNVAWGGTGPAAAIDTAGAFVLAWTANFRVGVQRFDAAGVAATSTTPTQCLSGIQSNPAIAMDADGDFIAAWESAANAGNCSSQNTGDNKDVIARRYGGGENVDLDLSLTDGADPVAAGGPLSYTVTVLNRHAPPALTGDPARDAYLGAVGTATGIRVNFAFPSGAGANVDAGTGTDWACTNGSCLYSGKLLPGATTSLTFNITAPHSGGSASAAASLSGGQFDATPSNDSASESTSIQAPPPPPQSSRSSGGALSLGALALGLLALSRRRPWRRTP